MKHMKLQDLLAPTWRERVRAEDALLAELVDFPDQTTIWPKEVQDEIRLLQPSPGVFLSALVAFWADVSEQQDEEWMKKFRKELTSNLPQKWTSPYLAQFPMEPPIPPVSTNIMRGAWVWSFISRLGPYAENIEQQLIACLDHPTSTVYDAAESAFGLVNSMSDEGFAQLLSFADRSGRNGQIWKRAQVIARHVTDDRMASVLENLEPGISEICSTARFAIIGKLDGNNAHIGLAYLLRYLGAPWSDDQLVDLIYAMASLSERIGFELQALPAIRRFAEHDNPNVQSAATCFLASHSPVENHDILKLL